MRIAAHNEQKMRSLCNSCEISSEICEFHQTSDRTIGLQKDALLGRMMHRFKEVNAYIGASMMN